MGALSGTAVLITGGASGLGRALVQRFLSDGANVAVLDRSEEGVAVLRRDYGAELAAVVGDVTSVRDNYRAVDEAIKTFGRLDTFIGNAGVWDWKASLLELPEDVWPSAFDELFRINVLGAVLGAKAAARELIRRSGSMIFTVSNAGFYPDGGGVLYTSSKHALVGVIRQLAFELAPRVRVNGVAPGGMRTDLRGLATLGQAGDSLGEQYDSMNPREPVVPLFDVPEDPDLHTGPYAFLASREAACVVTGVVIEADRGLGVRGIGRAAGGSSSPGL